jgi:hypothetical protein
MQFKINKFLTASLLTCMAIGGLLFNACTSTEPASTITLTAFGPSAALRGSTIKFIGTNLDKVTAIDLPGTAEITSFVSKTATEIVITIPQDTKPGLVVLKTPQGDITTKTPLTFTEPIKIDTYSPATVKAGDVLTINGDYLNLISQVIFSNGVVVDTTITKFQSQSRKKIEVIVPLNAQTGKVSISNGAEIPVLVYTATPLNVVLPVITSFAPNPVKAGTNITITGTDFQLVKSVVFTDGLTVTGVDLLINDVKTSITVKVPATAKEGKLKLVAQSGVEVASTANLTLITPTITSVTPNPVKNGSTITVKGTNLDLVTGVTFAGVVGTIGTLSSNNTSLVLTVPLTATNGTLILSTNSGKTVESASITYIKPTISSIAPLSLTAGDVITITGTDLDLVSKVTFGGGLSVDVTPSSAQSFTVAVPMTAVSGKITLLTSNGSEVTSSDVLNVSPANKPVITGITPSVKPGGLVTITGSKLNLVESIYFMDNVKAVLYGVRSETSIEVYVPDAAKKGAVTLTLNAFDGSKVVSPVFTISGTDPVTDPSLMIYSFDAGWSGFTWDGVGGLGTLPDGVDGTNNYYEATPWDASKYWLFANNYISYPSVSVADHVLKMDVRLRKDVTGNAAIRIMLAGIEVDLKPYLSVSGVWSTGGDWKTITIPLSSFTGMSDPTPVKGGNWGMEMWANGLDFSGLCVDNIRYEKATTSQSVHGLY